MTDEFASALRVALRRLQAADRYEAEIRRALTKYPAETTDAVLAYLKEKRLLNDGRTTEFVLATNRGRRALGAHRIEETLARRGAPEPLIAEAVAATRENEDQTAKALLTGKFPNPTPKDRAKAGRFLYGRGFDEDVIENALERHFGSVDFSE